MCWRIFIILITCIALSSCRDGGHEQAAQSQPIIEKQPETWTPPDTSTLGTSEHDQLILYGRKLVRSTAFYIGPKGSVSKNANGMNCQNCHLDAGTKAFGNNYSAVSANYPKFRERSGTVESIYKRVNDCIERSLNGKAIDTTSREMQAFKAYIEWLGKNVSKGTRPPACGITELAYLDESANVESGKKVYLQKCQRCHGFNGEGKMDSNNITCQYPPLWGPHSYSIGAGIYRISRFAGYVKSNMPFGVVYDKPELSDEEAWNVAAYVNSQPRPSKDISKDWPKISGKPVDHPFGPYTDTFNEHQHKYGPFLPIAEFKKNTQVKK